MGDQGDTYGYRGQDEIEEWMGNCPIERFRTQLIEIDAIESSALDEVDAQVQDLIDASVEFAKQAPYPDPSEVFKDVYA